MIQSIEIENFRCFEKTEVNGFQRMNLITGMNNSGKTALLEAFFYCFSEIDLGQTLISTKSRASSNDVEKLKNLYFNQNDKKQFKIIGKDSNRVFESIAGTRSHHYPNFLIKFIIDKKNQLPELIEIAPSFDNFFIEGRSKIVQDSLHKIDNNIAEIRTFSSRPDILFLRKQNEENYLPIYYFGDAIQKIARYIINILELSKFPNQTKILLIDEIENGLHYTAQDEFWRMLFKLCIEFDVQLFATTHSLEMIKAYQRIANEFEDEAAYFEMARHAKTNQIIAIKHEMEVLEYELVANETVRGE